MESAVQEAVHALKYRNVRALAPVLGAFVADHIRLRGIAAETVVPVPLHGGRLRERGYNQAELLARVVAKELDLDLCPDGLSRVRATTPQVSARRDDRRRNVAGAFQATRRFEGQRVVLMDDVSTTGATFAACAEALREAGALEVWGVAIAREI